VFLFVPPPKETMACGRGGKKGSDPTLDEVILVDFNLLYNRIAFQCKPDCFDYVSNIGACSQNCSLLFQAKGKKTGKLLTTVITGYNPYDTFRDIRVFKKQGFTLTVVQVGPCQPPSRGVCPNPSMNCPSNSNQGRDHLKVVKEFSNTTTIDPFMEKYIAPTAACCYCN
jgi:hypothetical protein